MSKRKCIRCGLDPAEGFASVWTAKTGEQWYCHGDDDESPTCYERAQQAPDQIAILGLTGHLSRPLGSRGTGCTTGSANDASKAESLGGAA